MNRKDADAIFKVLEEATKEVVVDVVGVSCDDGIPTLDCSVGGCLFEVQIGLAGRRLYRDMIPTKAVIKCLKGSVKIPEVPIFIKFYKGDTDNESKT